MTRELLEAIGFEHDITYGLEKMYVKHQFDKGKIRVSIATQNKEYITHSAELANVIELDKPTISELIQLDNIINK